MQQGIYFSVGFLFQGGQGVNVPGVQNEWLFADHVGAYAKAETDMGIVEIVGGADGDIINGRSLPPELFTMPVEALEFGEEMGFGEVFVKHSYGIVFIEGCKQVVACFFDSLQVFRGDVAGCSY